MMERCGPSRDNVPGENAIWKSAIWGECRMTSLILLGDVNLMNVADPAVPFRLVGPELRDADLVFANLECCLYRPPVGYPGGYTVEHEGFYADPEIAGEALRIA